MRTRDVRILDDAARKKRREKWVEALHKDNFQNDKGDAQVQILEQVEKERVRRSKERKGFTFPFLHVILYLNVS